ncbi:N-(5'-phosphoribosyl)anthranilate isomerase [Frondihabitans sp. 762G35]|uniref:phosphoribosylanthranilate isomerase n=1 Tax=Frondihabitans sp. 762G35 TaxID=1446794 RepID=UPI000D2029A3|nr:phosphoribosylanthranilate isomerase [Frondihabitans sp. 762G35]ARC58243.1 N-(5'-phosphoribosyl)anthranilate isomerase [Frondihabitans sp. 762G35]
MPSPLWIKICGLSTPASVDAAVDAGADAVGFVFASGSPREVTPEVARSLVERVPAGVGAVGVFRDQPVDVVLRTASAAGVSTVQFHGHEHPADFERARAAGFGVIRATTAERWLGESDAEHDEFGAHRLLLDAPDPGAGATFDSAGLLETPPRGPWVLAGGLRPDNVARLVAMLRPAGVDVSSGVESSRGVKDVDAIRRFVAAARG